MNIRDIEIFRDKGLIGKDWIDSEDRLPVINPATEEVLGFIPNLGQKETRQAIDIAAETQKSWSRMLAKDRSSLMRKWADLMVRHKSELATILTLEQGKNIKEAEGEIIYAASFVEWFAEQSKRIYGEILSEVRDNQKIIVTKQPVGVVGAITPWNFPAAMITRKISPAIAAGCTIVLKPSEETPFTALALVELALRAGIPTGVINVVLGQANEIGLELCSNSKVRKISFTGSTNIGKKLAQQAAPDLKRLSLELGGNAPFIVCADADLDKAIDGLLKCKFRNNGQTCISANRVFLAREIKDRFVEKLLPMIQKIKVGDVMDPQFDLGTVINQKALNKIETLLQDAKSKGAKIIEGGNRIGKKGFFFEPTVIDNVTDDMDMSCNEIFGPVIALYQYDSLEEVIKRANNTVYGLSSYIYTQDYSRVWTLLPQLEYGMVGFNDVVISNEVAPFGGIKHSGYGREGAHQGIEEYLQTKYISLSTAG